jgi:hypothetical protein
MSEKHEDKMPGEPSIGYAESLGEHATNPVVPRTSGEAFFLFVRCEDCNGTGFNPIISVDQLDTDDPNHKCPSCNGKGHTGEVESEWIVSCDEARLKAQFEQWVKKRAMLVIAELEGENPDMVRSMQAAFIADRAAGAYTWDGAACRGARADLPGLKHLFFLLLRRCHPDLTQGQSDKMFARSPAQAAFCMRWALGNPVSPSNRTEGKSGREERETIKQTRQAQGRGVVNPPAPQTYGDIHRQRQVRTPEHPPQELRGMVPVDPRTGTPMTLDGED